eukprot:32818_1
MDSRWDHNSNSFSHTPATNPSINCYQAQRFPHDESARFNVESYAMSNPPVSTWTNNNNYMGNNQIVNATPCVQGLYNVSNKPIIVVHVQSNPLDINVFEVGTIITTMRTVLPMHVSNLNRLNAVYLISMRIKIRNVSYIHHFNTKV